MAIDSLSRPNQFNVAMLQSPALTQAGAAQVSSGTMDLLRAVGGNSFDARSGQGVAGDLVRPALRDPRCCFPPAPALPPSMGDVMGRIGAILQNLGKLIESVAQLAQSLQGPQGPQPGGNSGTPITPEFEQSFLRQSSPEVQAGYKVLKASGYPVTQQEAQQLRQLGHSGDRQGVAKFMMDRLIQSPAARQPGGLVSQNAARYMAQLSPQDQAKYKAALQSGIPPVSTMPVRPGQTGDLVAVNEQKHLAQLSPEQQAIYKLQQAAQRQSQAFSMLQANPNMPGAERYMAMLSPEQQAQIRLQQAGQRGGMDLVSANQARYLSMMPPQYQAAFRFVSALQSLQSMMSSMLQAAQPWRRPIMG